MSTIEVGPLLKCNFKGILLNILDSDSGWICFVQRYRSHHNYWIDISVAHCNRSPGLIKVLHSTELELTVFSDSDTWIVIVLELEVSESNRLVISVLI
jgi:hypothetical protein